MLIFNDPISPTVLLGLTAAATAAAAGGQIISAQAESADLQAQADAEAVSRRRELRDEREQSRRQLARTRALLSARGADLSTVLSLTGAQAGESGIRQQRIRSDSAMRASGLRTRASNVRRAGLVQAGGSLLGGAADFAQLRAGL